MGFNPQTVKAIETPNSVTAMVSYGEDREGLIKIIKGIWVYGGFLIGNSAHDPSQRLVKEFQCNVAYAYRNLLLKVKAFFEGEQEPVTLVNTFVGQATMIAARRSIKTGRTCPVSKS